MTYPNPFRDWGDWGDWGSKRVLDPLSWLWSTSSSSANLLTTGPAGAYKALLTKLREQLIGRRLNIRTDSGDIALTVTQFQTDFDMRELSVGQLNEIRLGAVDIVWKGTHFDKATVVAHNVHIKPTTPPTLVGAPIELEVETSPEGLAALMRGAVPKLTSQVDENSVATLQLTSRPALGHVEVDAYTDGSSLRISPRALVLWRTRLSLPKRTPAYRIPLPSLPGRLELTSVDFGPNSVHLAGRLPEWQLELPRNRLDEVMQQLSSVGKALNLRWRS